MILERPWFPVVSKWEMVQKMTQPLHIGTFSDWPPPPYLEDHGLRAKTPTVEAVWEVLISSSSQLAEDPSPLEGPALFGVARGS